MLSRFRKIREDEGFTLAELSTVVVILCAVSAVAVVSFDGITGGAKAVACAADKGAVTVAGVAFIAQSALGVPAASLAALVAAGLLDTVPANVTYTPAGTSFTVKGIGPCVA